MAKLKVMCARSMHKAVEALTNEFGARTGHEVALEFGTVGALQAKIAAGEGADVMILGQPAMEKLAAEGKLAAGTRRAVASTFIAVCVRAGAPTPDISTPQSFERALRGVRTIALSDPAVGGSAGTYLVGLFERLNLRGMIAEKGMPQPSGVEVAKRVAEGKAELGLTLSGEIASVPGATIAGPLPAPLGQITAYAAAVTAACGERAAAEAFIAALTAPTTRAVWERAGFEVPGARA